MEFEWLFNPVLEIIQKILSDLIIEIIEGAFSLIIWFIKTPIDINAYLPVQQFLGYIQILAGALLVLNVVWEGHSSPSDYLKNPEDIPLAVVDIEDNPIHIDLTFRKKIKVI